MLTHHVILRVVVRALLPFIVLFAFYVQMHGKVSPGGGFQAGTLLASAFILYALVFGTRRLMRVISLLHLRIGTCLGVMLYGGVGVYNLLRGEHFLDYSPLLTHPTDGQVLGIFLVELGVGITVFCGMLLLFLLLTQNSNKSKS